MERKKSRNWILAEAMKKGLSLIMLVVLGFGVLGFIIKVIVGIDFVDESVFPAEILALADVSFAIFVAQTLALAAYDLLK